MSMVIWSFISIAYDQPLVRNGSPQIKIVPVAKQDLITDKPTFDSLSHSYIS